MNYMYKFSALSKTELTLADMTCVRFLIFMNLSYFVGMSQLDFTGLRSAKTVFACIGIVFIPLHGMSLHGRKYSLSEFTIIIVSLAIGSFAFMKSGEMTFMKLILFWLGCRSVNKEKLLKYHIISLILSSAFILLTCVLKIANIRYAANSALFTFGFKNPNNLPVIVTSILFSYCLLQGESLTKKSIFLQITITLVMYLLTNCRSAPFILLLFYFLLLVCFLPVFRKLNMKLITFLPAAFLLFAIVSYSLARFYNPGDPKWVKFNLLLSWRPYLWNQYFVASSLTLFGLRMDNVGTLDNAYLVLIFKYGLIVFTIYFLAFQCLSKIAIRENNLMLGLAILCYEIYFLFEFTPLLVNVNTLILILISQISGINDNKPSISEPTKEESIERYSNG